jgi:DNA modification methylase
MGSLYRSKHELVGVFRNRGGKQINNVQLGASGRYRTNVWDYAGANTFRAGRDQDLRDHPTVKPVAMIADAILDCSRRRGLVLDPFGGSGTTLLAAERTGRIARLIELDPRYVDVTIKRWLRERKPEPVLAETGEPYSVVQERRETEAQNATSTTTGRTADE